MAADFRSLFGAGPRREREREKRDGRVARARQVEHLPMARRDRMRRLAAPEEDHALFTQRDEQHFRVPFLQQKLTRAPQPGIVADGFADFGGWQPEHVKSFDAVGFDGGHARPTQVVARVRVDGHDFTGAFRQGTDLLDEILRQKSLGVVLDDDGVQIGEHLLETCECRRVARRVRRGMALAVHADDVLLARDDARFHDGGIPCQLRDGVQVDVLRGEQAFQDLGVDVVADHPHDGDVRREFAQVARDVGRDAIGASIDGRGDYNVEYRVIHPDGATRWVAASGRIVAEPGGADERVVAVAHDITARKLAEDRARFLAEAGSTLATLVDERSTLHNLARLSVPFLGDWCIVDTSAEGGRIERIAIAHHDPSRAILGGELRGPLLADPDARRGPAAVIRSGKTELIEAIDWPMPDRAGAAAGGLGALQSMHPTSYLCAPIKGRGGILGAITFLMADSGRRFGADDRSLAEDLANRAAVALENVRLYAALQEAARHKDEFLATLAHELRNPLAPIKNTLALLDHRDSGTADLAESLPMMGRQVSRLAHLVDDLLDIARISRGKINLRPERVDLTAAVRQAIEAVRPLLDERKHQLIVETPAEPILIDADPTRLEQIFWNLLNNAAKYSDPGGRIDFRAERIESQAVIRVRDSGYGIEAGMLSRIFEMFVQAGPKEERFQGGLGIGLSLVRSLVQLHHGTIEALSEGLGLGSEFVVRLPATGGPAPAKPEGPGTAALANHSLTVSGGPPPPPRPRKILVVDDNVDAAVSLTRILGRIWRQEVQVCHDGPGALSAIDSFRPELIILDIGMPGMNGYEVAERVRARPDGESYFLAALTGWGQEDDRRRSREAGFDLHLVKPVDPEALGALLNSQDQHVRAPLPSI